MPTKLRYSCAGHCGSLQRLGQKKLSDTTGDLDVCGPLTVLHEGQAVQLHQHSDRRHVEHRVLLILPMSCSCHLVYMRLKRFLDKG